MSVRLVHECTFASRLDAPADLLWRCVIDPHAVHAEFRPWLSMRFPSGLTDITRLPDDPPYRSWLLLFGLIPVEYDDLRLTEVEPPRRFLECSEMLTQRLWRHERLIEPDGGGAVLRDRVGFTPRVSLLAPLTRAVVSGVFEARHRALVRRHGGERLQGSSAQVT